MFVGGGEPHSTRSSTTSPRAPAGPSWSRSRLIERIGPVMERLAAHGLDVTATTLQANRLKPLAGGHRLAAENPVTVIVGRRL